MRTTQSLVLTQLIRHALPIAALCCLPVIKWNEWWWHIPRRELLPAVLLIGAYGLSALLVAMFVRKHGLTAAARAIAITLSVFAICLFSLLLLRIAAPRYVLLPVFLAAVILVPLSAAGARLQRVAWGVSIVAALAAVIFTVRAIAFNEAAQVKVERTHAKSAFYSLQATSRTGLIPEPATRGGGLDLIGDRVLLGTGDGHLYLLDFDEADGTVAMEELPTRVPSNREEFAAAFGGSSRSPKRAVDWTERGAPRVQTWRFRVADVIAQQRPDRIRLYASHHYWKTDDECFVVRVSTLDVPSMDASALRDAHWQTLFDTTPCVPLEGELRKRGKNPFKGEEAGGRMAFLDDNTLLLTVGDHGFYGLESLQVFAQDPNASYGKTIRIDLATGSAEIFTTGHRNPQGLFVTREGRIWLTEHGSQGGDEINLLQQGANYGWPLVTYGTEYGALAWPLSQQQNRHEGFVQPAYAWVPSIGVSAAIQIASDKEFPIWRGDLLVGSLATRSLYRVVLNGEHAILSEPIALNQRVRDLLELPDGRILVWTDDAALLTVQVASGTDGAATFSTMCMGCHQAVDGISHRIGPDLYGILDRGIADAPGYDEYSAALRSHPGRWTREHLDSFLREPQTFAPGTTMAFGGISDDQQRKELIDYLAGLSDE